MFTSLALVLALAGTSPEVHPAQPVATDVSAEAVILAELDCLLELQDPLERGAERPAEAIRLALDWLVRNNAAGSAGAAEALPAVSRALAWLGRYQPQGDAEARAISSSVALALTWISDTVDPQGAPDKGHVGDGFSDSEPAVERRTRRGAPATAEDLELISRGLGWLARHQTQEGYWDVDEFMTRNAHGPTNCDGAGSMPQDVGVTSLALLAFLGDGNTLDTGPHKLVVSRAVEWLTLQQDPTSGLIGDPIGHMFMYDHGIASLALCEAYLLTQSAALKPAAQRAVNFILRARNPYGAWRYDVPPVGDNDTSVTSWMVFALKSAKDGGLTVDKEAFEGALNWINEVSDPATGRIGYDSMGSTSSRVVGMNDHFPPDSGEAMTAAGLLCRFLLGQDPARDPVMKQHADLMLRNLPRWDPEGFGCDFYYWYYGTFAMLQMGGKHWNVWSDAIAQVIHEAQRTDGDCSGSWDPSGPWGYAGGRVYSTACMLMCAQAYYRYAQITGTR